MEYFIIKTSNLLGLNYLGICSGAYFASEEINMRGYKYSELFPSQPLLKLISTTASCNIFKKDIKDDPAKEGKIVKISCLQSSEEYHQYFNGGCSFTPQEGGSFADTVEVMASYAENGEPAVIRSLAGKGRVCLIGGHPENNGDTLPEFFNDRQALIDSENIRKNFLKDIFRYLEIIN